MHLIARAGFTVRLRSLRRLLAWRSTSTSCRSRESSPRTNPASSDSSRTPSRLATLLADFDDFLAPIFPFFSYRQGRRDRRETTGFDPANRFLLGVGEGREESEEEECQRGGGGAVALAGTGGEPAACSPGTLRHHRPH